MWQKQTGHLFQQFIKDGKPGGNTFVELQTNQFITAALAITIHIYMYFSVCPHWKSPRPWWTFAKHNAKRSEFRKNLPLCRRECWLLCGLLRWFGARLFCRIGGRWLRRQPDFCLFPLKGMDVLVRAPINGPLQSKSTCDVIDNRRWCNRPTGELDHKRQCNKHCCCWRNVSTEGAGATSHVARALSPDCHVHGGHDTRLD